MSTESLTLKWGTLKAWDFKHEKTVALLQRYAALGCSMGAMTQHDTPEQKQIICELIDAGDFETVYLSWDGKDVSKAEAKEYVLNYGKNQKPLPSNNPERTE